MKITPVFAIDSLGEAILLIIDIGYIIMPLSFLECTAHKNHYTFHFKVTTVLWITLLSAIGFLVVAQTLCTFMSTQLDDFELSRLRTDNLRRHSNCLDHIIHRYHRLSVSDSITIWH